MSGPIVRAVKRAIRLQEIALENRVFGCDFPKRRPILAFSNGRAINGHEQATAKDEAVKRGVA